MSPLSPCDNRSRHIFLATGNTLERARQQATHFIDTTQLVVYQSTTIRDDEIRSATSEHFWTEIATGIAANHSFCSTLFQELQATGLNELKDLLTIQTGYPSKLLHILTHMLDGFFGTDSVFYNLVESSHWISEELRETIKRDPGNYWLIPTRHGMMTSSLFHPGDRQPVRISREG